MHEILVIDDEEQIRTLFRDFLEMSDYSVTCCATGEEGLEAFKKSQPDLVICDLVMPGEGGVAAITALKAIAPEIPVFAVSGRVAAARGNVLLEAVGSGADLVFAKPVELKELRLLIEEALSSTDH